jgi:c-di-GMP-binding flagellar brake protein YcgR
MPAFLRKFLILLAALNTAALAQTSDSVMRYEDFIDGLSRALNKDFSMEIFLVVAVIIILLVIFVVIFEISRSNKTRKELLALAWVRFDFRAEQLKLNPYSISILKKITHNSGLKDPDSVMKSPQVFEHCLEKYYEDEKLESILNRELAEIRNLRKSLGFLPLSRETAFTSTRQFSSGEKCTIQIPENGPAVHKGMCLIIDMDEQQWSIARTEGPQVAAGTWVRLNLTRPGDAEYAFRAQVLEDVDGLFVLSHTSKLSRTQQRNWVRVDVRIPVEATQLEGERISDIYSGEIIDMSGGGLGMALPAKLPNGTNLLLSFELPGQGPITDLPVKVVRVAGPFNKDTTKIVHSVAFEGDVHLIQEQIIHYVFEKQRQNAQSIRST